MNNKSLYNLTYGVYLLSANDGTRDNACIINTAVQVANNPTRVSVSVVKGNLTHDMIMTSKRCNLSALSTSAPYSIFADFGMRSGREVNKFDAFSDVARSENGLYYLTKHTTAFLSLEITQMLDLGTHTMFIGEVVDGEVLANDENCTYTYYQTVIKANANSVKQEPKKSGWRCTVCDYVYEGDELPEDFVCPICKHGAEDFERIGDAPAEKKEIKKFVCKVCGYVHEGEEPPEICPLCHVPASEFEEIK